MNDTRDEARRIRDVYVGYRGRVEGRWTFANRGNLVMKHERNAILAATLDASKLTPLAGKTVLEVGCGSGGVLQVLRDLGAEEVNLHGVDLIPERIAVAMQRLPKAHLRVANAARLDMPDGSADVVLVFGVLSSIFDAEMRRGLTSEIARVLSARGAALVYDFRIPNVVNRHTRPVRPGEIRALFAGHRIEHRSLTVIPQLARRLGPLTDLLYPLFAKAPLLRSHMLYVIRPMRAGELELGPLAGFSRLA